MALMVYNAPKWFLALRQAWLAIVGGFPSVDHILLRVYFFLEAIVVSEYNFCVSVRLKGNSRASHT